MIMFLQSAWDSYIQGTNSTGMEPNLSWPMNIDLGPDGQPNFQGQQQSGQGQGQQQGNVFGGFGGLMG